MPMATWRADRAFRFVCGYSELKSRSDIYLRRLRVEEGSSETPLRHALELLHEGHTRSPDHSL